MLEMGTLGTIAIIVRALVIVLFDRPIEPSFGPLDVIGNLGKVGKFKWGTVFVYELHQIDVVIKQTVSFQTKLLLGKVVGLIDQINVLSVHYVLASSS